MPGFAQAAASLARAQPTDRAIETTGVGCRGRGKTPPRPIADIPSIFRAVSRKSGFGVRCCSEAVVANKVSMSDDLDTVLPGPAMEVLTVKQRGFVLAMLADPLATPSEWARAAGYDPNGIDRVAGHKLSRDPRIEAAATELARANLNTFGPVLGIGVMMMIARNSEHRDQLKAAAMLANRSGFHEVTEQVVSVTHSDRTGKAWEERIRRAAAQLGVDPGSLLGANAPAEPMRTIEAKVVDG